jgi:hypothetical protein
MFQNKTRQESSPTYTPDGTCREKYRHDGDDSDFQNGMGAVKSEPENGNQIDQVPFQWK